MAEGTSYWTIRRRVRANVDKHLAHFVNSNVHVASSDSSQSHMNEPQLADDDDIDYSSPIQSTNDIDNYSPAQSAANHESDCETYGADMKSFSDEENGQMNFEQYFDRHHLIYDSDSDTLSDAGDENFDLREKIREWAVKNQIPNTSLSDLLTILRTLHPELPKDPRTLLKTKIDYDIQEICGGQYYHFGIVSSVTKKLEHCINMIPSDFCLKLQVNIDGLPLFKSSNHQFWPILGMLQNVDNKEPFIIGLFSGVSKPDDLNQYLSQFIDEYKQIQVNGFYCLEKHLHIVVDSVICDSPARAFVKKVKSYSGYHGCDKCTQEGVWVGKMTFPETNAPLRTDVSFDEMRDEDHHKGVSPLSQINLGMVSQIPIDYMHLVCLGVMKRIILLWMKGPLTCRLSTRTIQRISDHLVTIRDKIPSEFARKPRSLFDVDRWKATEFRQFLLYTGPLVLCDKIHPNIFGNFLLLFVSLHILLNEKLSHIFNAYAHDLLVAFVGHFYQIYGNDMAVYNIHGLVHLAAEAENYGSLDNISAFPFENFLSQLKRMVRKPLFPLPQVIRRLSEQNNITFEKTIYPVLTVNHRYGPVPDALLTGTQFQKVKTEKYQLKLDISDNCVRIRGCVCLIKNIIRDDDCIYLVYQKFGTTDNFFTSPLESHLLGIVVVSNLRNNLLIAKLSDIEAKCVLLPYKEKHVAIPFTDSVWSVEYAVVVFTETNEVEVVPAAWLNDNCTKCLWPNFKSTTKINMAVKNAIAPSNDFKAHFIRILYRGDYEHARKKLSRAETTSDLQTDAEDIPPAASMTKRKKRPNPRYESSTDEDEEIQKDERPIPRKSPRKLVQQRLTSRNVPDVPVIPPPAPVSQSPARCTTQIFAPTAAACSSLRPFSTPSLHQSLFDNADLVRSPKPSTAGMEKLLLTTLEEVKETTNINKKLLQAILRKLDGLAVPVDHTDNVLPEDLFPLRSHADIRKVEESLESEDTMKNLVNALSTIGGENMKMTVRRLLAFMITNENALTINWMGKGNKLAFSSLKLKEVVTRAVRRNRCVQGQRTRRSIQ